MFNIKDKLCILLQTFERAMKFSFDEFHVWYQFALSLICAEKVRHAGMALTRYFNPLTHRLMQSNPSYILHFPWPLRLLGAQ